jgi:retron-type reverse transcriptase
LPAVSKILERLMYNRLISFLDRYNILAKQQFGFRKGRSTEHAVVHLVDYITNCFDKKQSVFGIFLDISKAFDSIDHEILLDKMFRYGFRGKVYDWFANYLADRRQYVVINGLVSTIQSITHGVPQGY